MFSRFWRASKSKTEGERSAVASSSSAAGFASSDVGGNDLTYAILYSYDASLKIK